ncbi:MAG: TIGR01212 family radical SAM protein [Agathobacter sp.]|nr:TIGR01212 family radical SAM protein [Agathobacter sp.]MBQ6812897.1 TIGR01212 family radical SAM protein [Agathobacter sp.]
MQIPQHFGDKRYYSLNEYCKNTFGDKVYRLSLNAGCTCPNRDGKLSFGGCTFCSEGGSGDFAADYNVSIATQIAEAKTRIQKKTDCNKFIAYFQAYTNTYAPISHLRRVFTEALEQPEIVGLSIGTRSDCLSDEILDLLEELSSIKPIWIELGLQTIHNTTHARLNTHTTLEMFDDAVTRLHAHNIPVITHIILGLPDETPEMMMETVKHVASLPVSGIKLQLLHILRGTKLAIEYENEPFPLFELEDYCDFIIDCLEILPPDMVIHRLTGDGPRKLLVAPLWSTDKKRVLNTIQKRFRERDTWQGKLFLI